MSAAARTTLDPAQARRIVEGRLGRQPQDMLEAAVVLEAWAGVPAPEARAAARALVRAAPPARPEPSVARLPRDRTDGILFEAAAFVIVVVSIAAWASPLASSLGADVMRRTLLVALPLTLALQWALNSRYLRHPHGLSQLGRRPRALAFAAVGLVVLPSALMGLAGTVAGLLTLTWTGGAILIHRHSSPNVAPGAAHRPLADLIESRYVYAAGVLVATAALLAGVAPVAVITVTGGATTLAVAAAVRSQGPPRGPATGGSGRALLAGLIGGGIGAMLVADPSVGWSGSSMPALALLPSTVASFWGGYHLWRLQHEILSALAGVTVTDAELSVLAWPAVRILLGAVARLVSLTTVLSGALILGYSWAGATPPGSGLLAGFGLIALATLLVSLLESLGRRDCALTAVAAAVAAEELIRLLGAGAPFPGAGLLVGGGVAVLIALPAALALLRRPASTLATSVWIR